RKITSLEEFFSTFPEVENAERMRRETVAVVKEEKELGRTRAEVRSELARDDGAVMLASRRETSLSLSIVETGNPFVEGQTWTLSFDRKGEVAHLQTEGVVTHYRRRSDGLVEIRFEDEAGRRIEAIPTTLMA